MRGFLFLDDESELRNFTSSHQQNFTNIMDVYWFYFYDMGWKKEVRRMKKDHHGRMA